MVNTRLGWALMHPGRLTHYHEGLPVTKGELGGITVLPEVDKSQIKIIILLFVVIMNHNIIIIIIIH